MFELSNYNHTEKWIEIRNNCTSCRSLTGWTVNFEHATWKTQIHMDDLQFAPGNVKQIDLSKSKLFTEKSERSLTILLIDPFGKLQSRCTDSACLSSPSHAKRYPYSKKVNLDLSLFDVEKVRRTQRAVRHFLSVKSIARLNAAANVIKNDYDVDLDPSKELLMMKAKNQSLIIQQIPYELWIEIISYIPNLHSLASMITVCELFYEISKINIFWRSCLEFWFPKVYQRLDFTIVKSDDINWKIILKKNKLLFQAFSQILWILTTKKKEGNCFYRKGEFRKAIILYQEAIRFANDRRNNIKIYESVINREDKIKYLHTNVALYSNSAQARLKLKNYSKVVMDCAKAKNKLALIKEFFSNNEYQKRFGALEAKVNRKMNKALEEVGPVIRLVHYSNQPVEQLECGTMLTHNNNRFGGGFFADSKVLLTSFNARSVTGLIINKTTTIGNRIIRIGGPCELSIVTTLHNIPHIRGSREICQGVYIGGDVERWLNDPEYIVHQYYGYASWFSGQLEGEIRNANGWEYTNDVEHDDVFHPEQMFSLQLDI